MAFRRRIKKGKSRRMFSRTAKKVNRKNSVMAMRGGRRL